MSLLRQSAWAAGAAIFLAGSRFALAALVARRSSQIEYGQFAYAQWLVDVAFLLTSFGLTGVISRYLAEYRSQPELLAAFVRRYRPWVISIPIVGGAGAICGTAVSGMPLSATEVASLAAWAFSSGLYALQTAALSGLQRFDRILQSNLLVGTLMLAGAAVVPLANGELTFLFLVMAAATGAGALIGLAITTRLPTADEVTLSPADTAGIRSYGLNIWLTSLLWSFVWSRGEFPIVRLHLGDAGVAAYAACMTLLGGVMQAVMLGIGAVSTQLTRLWGESRRDEAFRTVRSVSELQLLICGFGSIALTCLGPELLTLAFGEDYRSNASALSFLGLGVLGMAASTHNHLLQIATNARFNRNTSVLGLVLLVTSAVLSTPLLGLKGAALSRAGTMLMLAGLGFYFLARLSSGTSLSPKNCLLVLAAAAGAVATVVGQHDTTLAFRIPVFLAFAIGLSLSVRDDSGTPTILIVLRQIRMRISSLTHRPV